MEFRSQKAIGLILAFFALGLPAADLTYQVRHDRLFRDGKGTVAFDQDGVVFRAVGKKPEETPPEIRWQYGDIQQLYLSPARLVVLTYVDRSRLLLGIDHEYEFAIDPEQDVRPAYELLRKRLDRRFVAALAGADAGAESLWEVPVKLLGPLKGSEGTFRVYADRIVYETARPEHSRTWRLEDIAQVASSDPYRLTLTTFERAKAHYGSRKDFNFALKEPLEPTRFDQLWRQISRRSELEVLTRIEDAAPDLE